MNKEKTKDKSNLMEKIISLAKRRGFIFPSSEIYGGFGSCYDFGSLGVEMKNNIKKAWWEEMIRIQENVVGIDAAILMSPKVWEASGHLSAGFADELVECKCCHKRFRHDQLAKLNLEEIEKQLKKQRSIGIPDVLKSQGKEFQEKWRKCECGEIIKEKPRKFNLMMGTSVGPVEDDSSVAYLRAETCQGIYVNFQNVLNSMRLKIPFGIAQIGKAFRNEITPGNYIFRTREFEQMEMQWFCAPEESDKFFDYWLSQRINWYLNLGIKKENLKTEEVKKNDLAHYAKRAVDIMYKFPFGWKEIEGVHNRGDWDLSNHSKHSGHDLKYFDEQKNEKFYPNVIETSVGADRSFLAFLVDSFTQIEGARTETTKASKEVETVLKLDKRLAPIQVAVFPLVKNKQNLLKKSEDVFNLLKPHFNCHFDKAGAIGRRYRRQDEIGTPFCVTVDFESLENNIVTVRDRDTMKQEKVDVKNILEFLNNKLKNHS